MIVVEEGYNLSNVSDTFTVNTFSFMWLFCHKTQKIMITELIFKYKSALYFIKIHFFYFSLSISYNVA